MANCGLLMCCFGTLGTNGEILWNLGRKHALLTTPDTSCCHSHIGTEPNADAVLRPRSRPSVPSSHTAARNLTRPNAGNPVASVSLKPLKPQLLRAPDILQLGTRFPPAIFFSGPSPFSTSASRPQWNVVGRCKTL